MIVIGIMLLMAVTIVVTFVLLLIAGPKDTEQPLATLPVVTTPHRRCSRRRP